MSGLPEGASVVTCPCGRTAWQETGGAPIHADDTVCTADTSSTEPAR